MGLYWLQLVTFDCCTICTLHTVHCTHMLVWAVQYNAHGLRCWEKPQAVALGDIWLDTVHKMHVSYNSGHRICALCTMQCNMMQRETTVCCSWWPQEWLEAAETPSSSLLVIIVLSVISAIIVTFVIVIIVIFTKMLHTYTLWSQYRSQAPPALVSKLSVLHCQSLVLHIYQPSLL